MGFFKEPRVEEWTVCVIQCTYSNARSHVRVNGQYSEEFSMGVGVMQGSVLSPLLFNLVLEALSLEFGTGVPWELIYTDDLVLITDTQEKCISKLLVWVADMDNKGLHINMKKGESRPPAGQTVTELDVDSTKPYVKATFWNLGDMLYSGGECDSAIDAKCCVAWGKFGKLLPILTSRHLSPGYMARRTRSALARLCSMVEKRGDLRNRNLGGSA